MKNGQRSIEIPYGVGMSHQHIELAKWLIPVLKANLTRMYTRHQYLLKLGMVLRQKLDYNCSNEISYIQSDYDGW